MPNDILSELAQTGVLGLLLAISISAIIFLFKELRQSRKDFTDYLLQNSEKDGELKNQIINALSNLSNIITQSKK